MKLLSAGAATCLPLLAAAAGEKGGFAVLGFSRPGFVTEGRVNPIVSPGKDSGHLHGVMGGSNFGLNVENDDLLSSNCTSTVIANDFSNYWVPELFFQDPTSSSHFEKVPLSYMLVYYFFERTLDDIEPFPAGMKMSHCPRTSYDKPSYPPGSDGTTAGIVDPQQPNYGTGFPLYPCDAWYLRQDVHFPSCYNPEAGLDDYKNNMAWPSTDSNGYVNCPEGYTHVPHFYYEVYWDTKKWDDGNRWTPDGKTQPYVFANGDATGFSSHGDIIAGWGNDTLSHIIVTCDRTGLVGEGMDQCTGIPGGLNHGKMCTIPSPVIETLDLNEVLTKLPGDNPVTGFGKGGVDSSPVDSNSLSSSPTLEPSTTAVAPGPDSTYPTSTQAPTVSTHNTEAKTTASDIVAGTADTDCGEETKASDASTSAAETASTEASAITVWDFVTTSVTITVCSEPTPEASIVTVWDIEKTFVTTTVLGDS
ncbi:Uu.00g126200.m01.CDS01 [Anthostomella pinea]|uniref:Uu.00g126200.m01.CDS01 n=1 Tax=Anthostomella pinea TaxID=933095 RepID=A0AAI8VIH1_9PEZI|nr:Uu.00g126200.m01.CDS01 [Anthostomella pinea]